MDADEFIINVIAKKSNGTIELSVPDDVFNQAERILLKNEQGVFCKTFPAESFGSDSWISTKDHNPDVNPKSGWSDDVLAIDKGLELHEQERIANKEYKQRLVARKEAESVLQTVSNADES